MLWCKHLFDILYIMTYYNLYDKMTMNNIMLMMKFSLTNNYTE